MKKITLYANCISKEGVYSLSLGNGYIFEFSQERKLKKFVNDCENFLTDQMYLTNELFSEMFSSYRRLWGFFHHDKESYRYKKYREEKEIRDCFTNVENSLEQLWSKTVSIHTNVYVFHSLQYCVKELVHVGLQLQKTVLNNPPEKIKISHLIKSLQEIERNLSSYQSGNASGLDRGLQVPVFELKIAN